MHLLRKISIWTPKWLNVNADGETVSWITWSRWLFNFILRPWTNRQTWSARLLQEMMSSLTSWRRSGSRKRRGDPKMSTYHCPAGVSGEGSASTPRNRNANAVGKGCSCVSWPTGSDVVWHDLPHSINVDVIFLASWRKLRLLPPGKTGSFRPSSSQRSVMPL